MRLLLPFLFLFCGTFAFASANYDFNNEAQIIYSDIISGKIPAAEKKIAAFHSKYPDNKLYLWLDDFREFMEVYLLETETSFAKYISNNARRTKALKKHAYDNAFYRYALTENYLHLAFVQFLSEEYVSGFWNMRKAFSIAEENQKLHPDFLPNLKNMALVQALGGMLPAKYHWLISFLGISPNLEAGLASLRKISGNNALENFTQNEALLIYGTLLFYTGNDKEAAIDFFKSKKFPQPDNLTGIIACANLMLHGNHNADGMILLQNIPKDSSYISVPYTEYLLGLGLLQQLDKKAKTHFSNYIIQTTSKHLLKSAFHKIAWSHLVNNNEEGYEHYMQKVSLAGKILREADKQAQREYEQKQMPHKELLKARLLFDGGYYLRAENMLNALQENNFHQEKDKVEWIYRKARLSEKTGNEAEAEKLYKATIDTGISLPYYFAANAALHLGYLYEKQNKINEAIDAYEKCISLKNHEYAASMEQKAKVALERLR